MNEICAECSVSSGARPKTTGAAAARRSVASSLAAQFTTLAPTEQGIGRARQWPDQAMCSLQAATPFSRCRDSPAPSQPTSRFESHRMTLLVAKAWEEAIFENFQQQLQSALP
ncbi:hypothetical protein MRX96_000005 [Rhipicephalus microplus]